MKWQVRGADRRTGEDASVIVEATMREEAEISTGLLVESVEAVPQPAPAPVLAYASPNKNGPASRPAAQVNPTHEAGQLTVLETLLEWGAAMIGLGFILVGTIGFFVTLDGRFHDDNAIGAAANGLTTLRFETGILIGVLLWIFAGVIRLRACLRMIAAR